jgi:phosphoenolpyruvate carboxykinase (GTP)
MDRVDGVGSATDTAIGSLPAPESLNLSGLRLADGAIDKLLSVDVAGWREELDRHRQFFEKFGDRLPQAMWQEHAALGQRLG